jgi:hypothetical protein
VEVEEESMMMSIRNLLRLRPPPADRERGDVPGWVLITLMTAGLVAALLAVAKPQLTAIFERAMELVSP